MTMAEEIHRYSSDEIDVLPSLLIIDSRAAPPRNGQRLALVRIHQIELGLPSQLFSEHETKRFL
jgi:hypothetical protein